MPRANPLLSKEGEPRSGGVVCSKPRSVVEQPRIETLHRDDAARRSSFALKTTRAVRSILPFRPTETRDC
jgi:hypothetical protein